MGSVAVIPRTPFDVRRNAREAFKRWRPYLGYRAEQVKAFAEQHYAKHGIEPTYSQVCEACDIPTRGEVSRIVAGLERRGEVIRQGCGREPRMKIMRNT